MKDEHLIDRFGGCAMENLDNFVDREFRQKQSVDPRRQSEAEKQLYWETYRRYTEDQSQISGKNPQSQMGLLRSLELVLGWWADHFPLNRPIGNQKS
jgi:hypothetical protein